MDVSTLLREEDSLQRVGLLVERCADGSVRANVAHVRFHSPTGFECGYAGSGPADLALSVLHALIPPPDEADEEQQYELSEQDFEAALDDPARWSECIGADRVRVSRLAYSLHQKFKEAFITPMPRVGGYVPIEEIKAWIAAERVRMAEATARGGAEASLRDPGEVGQEARSISTLASVAVSTCTFCATPGETD